MFKKIVACISAVLFIFMSVITASADGSTTSTGSSGAEHGGSSGKFGDDSTISINSWTWRSFDNYLHDYDLTDHVFDNLKDLSYKMSNLSSSSCVARFDKKYLSGGSFLSHLSFYCFDSDLSYKSSSAYDYAGSFFSSCNNFYTYNPFNDSLSTKRCNGDLASYLSVSYGGYYDDNYCYIVSDIDVYRSLVSQFPNFSEQIFYCSDPLNSFLTYSGNYDFNPVVPPAGFSKNAIKYSNFLDCCYGKYGAEPYENETDNYVTSGLFTDLDLYYSSKFIKGTSSTDHNEDITFYIPAVDIKTLQLLYKDVDINWSSFLTSAVGAPAAAASFDFISWYKKWYLLKDNPAIDNINWDIFFEKHFRSVHYEKDSFTPLDFFNDVYNKHYTSFNDFVKLKSIKDKLYIVFTMSSKYSVTHTGVGPVPGGGSNLGNDNAVFTGTRVTHTATRFDPKTGEVGKNKDGLGSDISQADDSLSRPPTKDELADLGFDYGYPNTHGSFPYAITIYRNGVEYFRMQFNKMPSVTSDYYSDKCIKYGFNIDNLKMYMYFKEQNMSKIFDFSDETVDDRNTTDKVFDYGGISIDNPVDVLSDECIKIFQSLLNVDTSEFSNTYTLYAWTNYTGEFPDNYNGFYVKFNWDLEKSGHFQKNNSDDNYDYSRDYKKEDVKKDNNGNIQGGGDDGAKLVPTEPPGSASSLGADFDFNASTLTGMVGGLLNFVKGILSIFPAWTWAVLLVGFTIIVVLRVLGR